MRIIKEDAISKLTDKKIVDEIVSFIKSNPFPLDHEQFHKHFEDLGYEETGDIEQYAYAMLSVILTGGASKGKTIKASKENIAIGKKIETEHVSTGIDNEVIKYIESIFGDKIMFDHLSETDSYYTDGVDFKKELKDEDK
jgi:hypothetical protein